MFEKTKINEKEARDDGRFKNVKSIVAMPEVLNALNGQAVIQGGNLLFVTSTAGNQRYKTPCALI